MTVSPVSLGSAVESTGGVGAAASVGADTPTYQLPAPKDAAVPAGRRTASKARVRPGMAGPGTARQGRHGRAGMAGPGTARQCAARPGRRGVSGLGKARHGAADAESTKPPVAAGGSVTHHSTGR